MKKVILMAVLAVAVALPACRAQASPQYRQYDFTLDHVHDGDTIMGTAAIWPDETIYVAIRIAGIDTPEMTKKCQKARAIIARNYMQTLVNGATLELYDVKLGKYAGRVVGTIKANGVDVGQAMLAKGLAHPYDGKSKRPPWPGC